TAHDGTHVFLRHSQRNELTLPREILSVLFVLVSLEIPSACEDFIRHRARPRPRNRIRDSRTITSTSTSTIRLRLRRAGSSVVPTLKSVVPAVKILRLYISPGHNYFGH